MIAKSDLASGQGDKLKYLYAAEVACRASALEHGMVTAVADWPVRESSGHARQGLISRTGFSVYSRGCREKLM